MWHLFCKVIDNFGDAGFALRLSRALCLTFSQNVILWIDQPDLIAKMLADEKIARFRFLPWQDESSFFSLQTHDVVVELFSCSLPDFALKKIKQTQNDFVWLSLDYLGLENWVNDFHLQPSFQQNNRVKYFYFPSFFQQSGGVIFEKRALPKAFDFKNPFKINVFLYDETLVPCLGESCQLDFLNQKNFTSQRHFDWALDQAALNLVRGEDSFVRAIFSGRPFVWQAYPQQENAHFQKVHAFLDFFAPFLDDSIRLDVLDFFYYLNAMPLLNPNICFQSLLCSDRFLIWQNNVRHFAQTLLKEKSLPERLMDFVKLKKIRS